MANKKSNNGNKVSIKGNKKVTDFTKNNAAKVEAQLQAKEFNRAQLNAAAIKKVADASKELIPKRQAYSKANPDEKLVALRQKKGDPQHIALATTLASTTRVVQKLAEGLDAVVSGRIMVGEVQGHGLGAGSIGGLNFTSLSCDYAVTNTGESHNVSNAYIAGESEAVLPPNSQLHVNPAFISGTMAGSYCFHMEEEVGGWIGTRKIKVNLTKSANQIKADCLGIVGGFVPAALFAKTGLHDMNVISSGTQREKDWALLQQDYIFFANDVVRLSRRASNSASANNNPVLGHLDASGQPDRTIENESGRAASDIQNNIIERGATENYWHNGEQVLWANLDFGSMNYRLLDNQFLNRKIRIEAKPLILSSSSLSIYDPCNPPPTLTVIGVCPDDDPCADVVSAPSGGGYVIVLGPSDWIEIQYMLDEDGNPCWRIVAGMIGGVSVGIQKDVCPEVLMDRHWLPSWEHSRGRFWSGPQPYLGEGAAPNAPLLPDGSFIDNAEVPSAVLRIKDKVNAPNDAVSFRFRPDTMRRGILWNLSIPFSTVGGELNPTDDVFLVSLYKRYADGSHRIVFEDLPTETPVNVDPGPGGAALIQGGAGALVGRDWAIAKLASGRSLAGKLVDANLYNAGGALEALKDPSPDGGFFVLRISRTQKARSRATHMIHGVRFRYLEERPQDFTVFPVQSGIDENVIPSGLTGPGIQWALDNLHEIIMANLYQEEMFYDPADYDGSGNLILDNGVLPDSLGHFPRDFLTLDGLEGRQVCCDPIAGPGAMPEPEEEGDCP